MKGKFLFLAGLLMTVLTGCDIKVTMSVADMTLMVGETREVTYTLDPLGLFASGSLEVVSSDPDSILSIEGMFIEALQEGVATIKATATNMPGAEKTFTTSKNFTVTIDFNGNYIQNGSFEQGLEQWNFDPAGSYTAMIDNPADLPHSGTSAFKLWYDGEDEDTTSDAIAVELYQNRAAVPAGDYLFSLWFTGDATNIIMTISHGEDILVTDEFAGFGYHPVPDHFGYVNLGIEVTLEVALDLNLSIYVSGPAGVYGFIDDVSLAEGDLDDLLKAPANAETGYVNQIENGTFDDADGWTVEITGTATSKQANFNSGKLRIWTNGVATLRIYQMVELTAETYNMCIYLNGGVMDSADFTSDAAYAYVSQGETSEQLDIEPTGWGDGTMTRIEKSDLVLSGEVEVGIYLNFTGGSNNWLDLDDFALWSFNIPE